MQMRVEYERLDVYQLAREACRARPRRQDGEPGLPTHIHAAEQELLLGSLTYLQDNPDYRPTDWASHFHRSLLASPQSASRIRALGGYIDTAIYTMKGWDIRQ